MVQALPAAGVQQCRAAAQHLNFLHANCLSAPPFLSTTALLYDGDRIAVLAAMLVKDLISALPGGAGEGVRVGIIQTAYANGAASDYIRDNLGCGVEVGGLGLSGAG